MKIFCLIIFFNLVSLRYLNLEKLSSTYHDIKKTNFDNRNLEDDDEQHENSEKEQRLKRLKLMEEKAIQQNLDAKKVAEHENDVGYVNPILKETTRYANEKEEQNDQDEDQSPDQQDIDQQQQEDQNQDQQNDENQNEVQDQQQQDQIGEQGNEQNGQQNIQQKSSNQQNNGIVKMTIEAAKMKIEELKQKEQEEVIQSIQQQLEKNQSRNPIIIINKPHQNYDQLISDQKEKLEKIKQNQNEQHLPEYEPEIENANNDQVKIYDEYGQVVSELSTHDSNQKQDVQSFANQKKYDYVNGKFQTKLKTDTINFNDIDTLINTLNTVQQLFDSYYELAPKEQEIMMEQKKEEEDEKSMLDQTLRVLQIYKRIKDFAHIVLTQGDELINDVHFLSDKVEKLKTNEDDMLKFFNLQEKYYNVKLAASLYESQDSKYSKYFYEIHGISDNFNNHLKTVLREVYNVGKYTEFFMNTVHHMYTTTQFSNVVDVLKTIDKILMMTLRLLEFHTDVTASIKQAKLSLNNLRQQKQLILNSLSKVDTLTQYYKYGVVDDQPASVKEEKKSSIIFKLSLLVSFFILM